MEPLIAFVVCVCVAIGVGAYKRWFFAEGERRPEFEAWCASRPLVLAVRRDGGGLDLSHAIRPLVAPRVYGNRNGVFPWQYYLVWVEERRIDADVLGVFVTGCRPRKERDVADDLETLVDAITRVAGEDAEFWLHGQLHAGASPTAFDRNRVSWTGSLDESGALELHEALAPPPWLRGGDRKAA